MGADGLPLDVKGILALDKPDELRGADLPASTRFDFDSPVKLLQCIGVNGLLYLVSFNSDSMNSMSSAGHTCQHETCSESPVDSPVDTSGVWLVLRGFDIYVDSLVDSPIDTSGVWVVLCGSLIQPLLIR